MNELMLFQLLVQPFSESSWYLWYPWYPTAPPHAQRLCFLLGQPSHGWSGGKEMSKCPAASKVIFFNHGIVSIVKFNNYIVTYHGVILQKWYCNLPWNLIALRQVCICCSATSNPSNVWRQKKKQPSPARGAGRWSLQLGTVYAIPIYGDIGHGYATHYYHYWVYHMINTSL